MKPTEEFMRLWVKGLEFVNKLTIMHLIIAFVVIIVFFAILFYFLTLIGHGIIFSYTDDRIPDFLDCIYFSVITISSLGYGDIRPTDISKFACSIEVLLGLIFIGLFIAKLASLKQDLYLHDIHSNLVKERLGGFCDTYRLLFEEYSQASEIILQCLATTPESQGYSECKRIVRGLNHRLKAVTKALRRYLGYCAKNKTIFDDVHPLSIQHLLRDQDKILHVWRSLPQEGRDFFSDSVGKGKLDQALVTMLGIAKVISENTKDPMLLRKCNESEELINDIRVLCSIAKDKDGYISMQNL